jgi:hypothetical protein
VLCGIVDIYIADIFKPESNFWVAKHLVLATFGKKTKPNAKNI